MQQMIKNPTNTITQDELKLHYFNLPNSDLLKKEFLAAWKIAIRLVGEEFFDLKTTLEEATEKDQLQPSHKKILSVVKGEVYAKGETLAFLGILYSFYDSEEGQRFFLELGYDSFIHALRKISPTHQAVIAELVLNYDGW